jgi:hypothetical protein
MPPLRPDSGQTARQSDDSAVPAVFAPNAKEAVRGNAAAKVRFELVKHEGGQGPQAERRFPEWHFVKPPTTDLTRQSSELQLGDSNHLQLRGFLRLSWHSRRLLDSA